MKTKVKKTCNDSVHQQEYEIKLHNRIYLHKFHRQIRRDPSLRIQDHRMIGTDELVKDNLEEAATALDPSMPSLIN